MAMEISRLHLVLPEDVHERLREMARDRDRSVSAETRRAIEARLDEWERGRHRRAEEQPAEREQAA